jgi:hypothetical protein
MDQEALCLTQIGFDAEAGRISQCEATVNEGRKRLCEHGLERILHRVVLEESPAPNRSQHMCRGVQTKA